MLTAAEIMERITKGAITITPFDEMNLGANSYDLTLAEMWRLERKGFFIDPENPETWELTPLEFNVSGKYALHPGSLYLALTKEYCEALDTVPCIEGRSSYARLGVTVHQAAGFGDIGFCGRWTLEISVKERVLLRPGIRICQVFFAEPTGEISKNYQGKYGVSKDFYYLSPMLACASRAHLDREYTRTADI